MRVLRYKLETRYDYQKGTPPASLSKPSQGKKEIQDAQQPEERYPNVNSHDIPLAPQNKW